MSSTNSEKTRRMVVLSILSALVIVLQLVSTLVKIAPFSLTFTLVPVVIGGALYGVRGGAWLGGVFGVIVLILCMVGADSGGAILWNASPLLTAALCVVKGVAAGAAAALAYKAVEPRNSLGGVICAAVVSPVVNTGIFVLAVSTLFQPILASWASNEGVDVVNYILFFIVGTNFLVELAFNLVLSSIAERLIAYRRKGIA